MTQNIASGMVLMSIYAFFIFRLRFAIAASISIFYSALYQILICGSSLADFQIILMTVLIWASQGAFILAGYNFERMARDLFVSTKVLSDRNNDIEVDLLKDFILSHRDLSPDSFSDALIAGLKVFAGMNQFNDDITVITVDIV